ncbi:hypothetical protein ACQPYE_09795 [Actinosynnema sp. CA-299493]
MNVQRLEIVLPADVAARDRAAVAHGIWAVLDSAGLGEDSSVRVVDDVPDDHSPAPLATI